MNRELVLGHLANAQQQLNFAKGEPCASVVENFLIDVLDYLIGAIEEMAQEEFGDELP